DSISCQNIYLLDYNEFTDFVKINKNGSKKAYKCNWKDCDLMVVLRKLDSNSNLQIVQENPENIFVHEEKMMIAYSTPDQSTDKMQLPYVAPEILRTEKHTCKADIYSLGIVLYEITTGLSPYHNILHDVNLEIKICNGIRPEFPSTMPKLVSQIISRCWDSEPSQRPKVEELNDELIQLHFTIEEN
ncbi:28964_t:CDS:2, partial [Gigaspora margarita]